jgi:hypothetical protein
MHAETKVSARRHTKPVRSARVERMFANAFSTIGSTPSSLTLAGTLPSTVGAEVWISLITPLGNTWVSGFKAPARLSKRVYGLSQPHGRPNLETRRPRRDLQCGRQNWGHAVCRRHLALLADRFVAVESARRDLDENSRRTAKKDVQRATILSLQGLRLSFYCYVPICVSIFRIQKSKRMRRLDYVDARPFLLLPDLKM